jgi:hypothetical protein
MGCIKTFSNFKQGVGFKNQEFKYFLTGFELGQSKINLYKLFEDSSNLGPFKISLNIQIQTKA